MHITFARDGSEKHLVIPVKLNTDRLDKRNYLSLIWSKDGSFGIYLNLDLIRNGWIDQEFHLENQSEGYCCSQQDNQQKVYHIDEAKLQELNKKPKFIFDDVDKEKKLRVNDEYVAEKIKIERNMRNRNYKETA